MSKCRECFEKRAAKFIDGVNNELVYAIYEQGFNDGIDSIEVDTGHIPTITEMREMVGGKMENASDRDAAEQAAFESLLVACDCGDAYPPDSFGAGFIVAAGHCQNCDAAEKGVK